MTERGLISAEPVLWTVEAMAASRTTGMVTGHEIIIPPPGGQLADAFGEEASAAPLTNFFSSRMQVVVPGVSLYRSAVAQVWREFESPQLG